jgi:hypothetical protein
MDLTTCVYRSQLMLYTPPPWPRMSLAIRFLWLAPITVAALVVLAGCLPGHTQPCSDLWPADTQVDRLVDQLREFRLCLPLRIPSAFNPLQHLGGRHPGIPLRVACGLR